MKRRNFLATAIAALFTPFSVFRRKKDFWTQLEIQEPVITAEARKNFPFKAVAQALERRENP